MDAIVAFFGGVSSLGAVSYTHLDVYKRQSHNCHVAPTPAGKDGAAARGRSSSRATRTNFMKYAADNRAVHAIYEFTTGPVSYTHLLPLPACRLRR